MFDVTASAHYAGKRILVHGRRSGARRALTPADMSRLWSCGTFRTLEAHAELIWRVESKRKVEEVTAPDRGALLDWLLTLFSRRASSHRAEPLSSPEESQSIKEQLEHFAQHGFLISDSELWTAMKRAVALGKAHQRAGAVAALGIPTCNRPDLLERCLSSYIQNMRRHDRSVRFMVANDSTDRDSTRATEEVARKVGGAHSVAIECIGRKQRLAVAERMARAAHVPPEVTRFALLGDHRCALSVGSARNTILLWTAGDKSIQVDDDTVCELRRTPDSKRGITFSSKDAPDECWFDAPVKLDVPATDDFVGIHDQLLGRSMAEIIGERDQPRDPECLEEVEGRYLRSLASADAHVTATLCGSTGDSGMDRPWSLLLLYRTSLKRVSEDAPSFFRAFSQRAMTRGPKRLTISESPFCMGINLGLDQSGLLPPFMPVLRNEDAVFMQVLRFCRPGTFSGFLPFTIKHDPQGRPATYDLSFESVVRSQRVNNCLCDLISCCDWPVSGDASHRMGVLGEYLRDASRLSHRRFEALVRTAVLIANTRWIAELERVQRDENMGSAWKETADRYAAAMKQALTDPGFFVPHDLRGSGEDRMTLFKSLLGQYGRLLVHWPAIVQVATEQRGRLWTAKRVTVGT